VKKGDGTPFKVFTPFWRNAEKYYIEKIPAKERIVKKCLQRKNYFQGCIDPKKYYQKTIGLKILKIPGLLVKKVL